MDTVNKIRKVYATGKYSQQYLADKYHVTQTAIGLIIRNKRWVDKDYVLLEVA